MRKTGFDAAIWLLPGAHAFEPIVGVLLEVITLVDRRHAIHSRNFDQLRFHRLFRIEYEVRAPGTLCFRLIPPLRRSFAARGIERPLRPPDDRVVAVAVPKRR